MTPDAHDDLAIHRTLIDACLRHNAYFCWRGTGLLAIHRSRIAEVLDDVVAAGFEILGFEGFLFEGPYVRPQLDLIFSRDQRPDIGMRGPRLLTGRMTSGSM
jgi:hypothetical protein